MLECGIGFSYYRHRTQRIHGSYDQNDYFLIPKY